MPASGAIAFLADFPPSDCLVPWRRLPLSDAVYSRTKRCLVGTLLTGFSDFEDNFQSMTSGPMISSDLLFGIIFLLQTGAGLLGNSSLLCLYLSFLLAGHKLKPVDRILNHLCAANTLVLLSKGIPQTVAALGPKDFLGDMSCKLLFYFHRVARGTSLCTTCLLSCFQALTINSSAPRWAELKRKASEHVVSSCFTCWLLNLLLQIVTILNVTGPRPDRNSTLDTRYVYCTSNFRQSLSIVLYALLLAAVEFAFIALMVWASGAMMLTLSSHRQQVQHIQSKHFSHQSSPETRATHTVLVMVIIFVSSYFLSSILAFYLALIGKASARMYNVSTFVAACFPTCSSFVLISRFIQMSRLSFAWQMSKINFPKL
ncbi:vomeronasal type-1 receptor 4-like [Echinops telfairi]|uniref:Vomeronasal type-1 receptor n=1 Tax=Echinops telfairi TaxID=9371 RepID=A0ABM1VKJ6_ECHTE|nr:vomeronasal type-1 receptor 4-like [Echinops telfairi]